MWFLKDFPVFSCFYLSATVYYILIIINQVLYGGIETKMSWNKSTVPVAVEERHELSLLIGKAFSQAYRLHQHSDETQDLLRLYRESRHWVSNENRYEKRYGAYDAYCATQGEGEYNV